ncbi:MAG: lamin tail domain-containing protein [Brevinematales bacterium]|nr:lamin tail domain-containing protein [Brevinematales bacterium]
MKKKTSTISLWRLPFWKPLYIINFIILIASIYNCELKTKNFNSIDMDLRDIVYINEIHYAGSLYNKYDNFIEIVNFAEFDINIGKWSLEIRSENFYQLISIPENIILKSKGIYTIGKSTNGAFKNFDLINEELIIPDKGFIMELSDGSGKYSDRFVLTNVSLPGGKSNNSFYSMIRKTGYFGPEDGDNISNWHTFSLSTPSDTVRIEYKVLASPGKILSGE